jgi:uncharacterized protein YdeI (BOF family)
MKKSLGTPFLFLLLILAVTVLPVLGAQVNYSAAAGSPQSTNAWFWQITHTVQEAWNADGEVVVVEGKVGEKVSPEAWNIFLFNDGTEWTIRANFGDSVPQDAIPINKTVRIVGEAKNGEVDVQGLEIMETVSVQPSATAKGINDGNFVNQNVSIKGQVGDKEPDWPDWWNYYKFTDSTGTTTVDLPDQDELPRHLIPQGQTSIIYGQAKNSNGQRVDSDYILLASFGDTPGPDKAAYLPIIMFEYKKQPSLPGDDWVWEKTNTIAQIKNRCCDDQVVVVEGKIGNKIVGGGIPDSWNYYEFSDGTGMIPLDFDDELPASAIPQNVTVRILGEPGENNNIHKIQVDALQTLGSVSVQTNATAAGINGGGFENNPVALIGRFGKLTNEWYRWFDFTDNTGTTTSDIGNNDISPSQIPHDRDVWIYGEGGQDFGWNKVDTEYFLVAKSYN